MHGIDGGLVEDDLRTIRTDASVEAPSFHHLHTQRFDKPVIDADIAEVDDVLRVLSRPGNIGRVSEIAYNAPMVQTRCIEHAGYIPHLTDKTFNARQKGVHGLRSEPFGIEAYDIVLV